MAPERGWLRINRAEIRSLQMLIYRVSKRCFRHRADNRLDYLSLFEQVKTWDTANGVGLSSFRILIRIEFHYLEAAFVLFGKVVHYRRDSFARTAPGRPEIHEHRDFGF